MKAYNNTTKGLVIRNGIFQYRKVIPEHLRHIAGKRKFLISLKTNNYNVAIQNYGQLKDNIEAILDSIKDGSYQKTERDFEHYVHIAGGQGRKLRCIKQIINNPSDLNQIRLQLENMTQKGKLTSESFKSFVNIQNNSIRLSGLTDHYAEINKIALKQLNDREYSRKIDARKNSCNKFIDFLGKDAKLNDLTKEDARRFQKNLKDLVYNDVIKSNTAYKHIVHLRTLISEYIKENDIGHENVFLGLRIPKQANKRPTISIEHIRKEWVYNPILQNMNSDLRYLLWAMIDTGCGAKELCGLDPKNDIFLQESIPHIIIRENKNRNIKTKYRERKIPLVGLALEAFHHHPEGFTRYNTPNGPTNASAALNKFLNNNNLFESDEHTIYGVRHCFSDRLRNHNTPEEVRDRIMGHQTHGMRGYYGNRYSLEKIYETMKNIEVDFSQLHINQHNLE